MKETCLQVVRAIGDQARAVGRNLLNHFELHAVRSSAIPVSSLQRQRARLFGHFCRNASRKLGLADEARAHRDVVDEQDYAGFEGNAADCQIQNTSTSLYLL